MTLKRGGKFQFLFEFGGGIVEIHSGAEKMKTCFGVNIRRFILALNKGAATTMIFLFYSRVDFFKEAVDDFAIIIKHFVVSVNFGADGGNSVLTR